MILIQTVFDLILHYKFGMQRLNKIQNALKDCISAHLRSVV